MSFSGQKPTVIRVDSLKEPNELHVGKAQEFKTINEALDVWEQKFNKNHVYVYVHPGDYYENIRLVEGNISIIGYDRESTRIISTDPVYNGEPIYIGGGNVFINKITAIAQEGEIPQGKNGCYGIHIDRGEKDGNIYDPSRVEINDCTIISHNHAGIGSGTENDQHIIIKDCDVYSYANVGILYHTGLFNYENQKFSILNCRVFSSTWYPFFFKNDTPNQLGHELEIINSTFISGDPNFSGKYHNDGNKNIIISPGSFGNNVLALNRNFPQQVYPLTADGGQGKTPPNNDLNNAFSGYFRCTDTTLNTPTGAHCVVLAGPPYYSDGRYTVQYAWTMFDGFQKYKRFYTTTWSAWKKVEENLVDI